MKPAHPYLVIIIACCFVALPTAFAEGGGRNLNGQSPGPGAGGVPVTHVSARPVIPCDIFVAPEPQGSPNNTGLTADSPRDLFSSKDLTSAGDTVCIMAGTYIMDRTFYPALGSVEDYVVYRGDYNGQALFEATEELDDNGDDSMMNLYQGINGVEINSLVFDGKEIAGVGIRCKYSHHARFVNNIIKNTSKGGIGTKFCDYVAAIGNKIHNFGMVEGWASGISFNSHQWTDSYPGIHSTIIGNMISGGVDESTHHSDGNGIIADLSNDTSDPSTADTPPLLIANNLVYQNGGRCIHAYVVTNTLIMGNTCYKNGLDDRVGGGVPREITLLHADDSFVANNIVHGWTDSRCYNENGDSENNFFTNNLYYECEIDVYGNYPNFFNVDPEFVNPPYVHPSDDGQWQIAVDPVQITDEFHVTESSPAIDAGITPWTISGIPDQIKADMEDLMQKDLDGNPRINGTIDLGAYEF